MTTAPSYDAYPGLILLDAGYQRSISSYYCVWKVLFWPIPSFLSGFCPKLIFSWRYSLPLMTFKNSHAFWFWSSTPQPLSLSYLPCLYLLATFIFSAALEYKFHQGGYVCSFFFDYCFSLPRSAQADVHICWAFITLSAVSGIFMIIVEETEGLPH